MGTNHTRLVRAAGTIPWRPQGDGLVVALVHRTKYGDWSWPKGKLDRGEDWASAAARETLEETGLKVRLGFPLPTARYQVGSGPKQVRYWAAQVIGGNGTLEHEVDQVRWLRPAKACKLLSYAHDREQLEALVAAHRAGRLDVWPLLIIRHAKAVGRGSWKEADPIRPLDATGRRRAVRIVPILDAFAPEDLLSSPSLRCYDTLVPYAVGANTPMRAKTALSEEGYEKNPRAGLTQLASLIERAVPAALCTHGPLFEDLLTSLLPHAAGKAQSRTLRTAAKTNLDKGEVMVCTMSGSGRRAKIIDIERHRAPR